MNERTAVTIAVGVIVASTSALSPGVLRHALPVAQPNANTTPAGRLHDGVLDIELVAALTMWHPDGASLPGIPVEAFAEPGEAPQVPGPLIRVRQGTAIRISIRNALARDTVTYFVDVGDARDSVVVAPGATGMLRVLPAHAGNFLYRATTSTTLGRALRVGGLLAGAVVIDPTGTARVAHDRVFVIQVAADAQIGRLPIPRYDRSVWAINGRSWPHTERLEATVGDTLHWRVINVGADTHPMHLHGFYYSVDAIDGPAASVSSMDPPSPRVVTTRLGPFAGMSMTWIPERGGNWLFHCHFADHVTPHGVLSGENPVAGLERIGAWAVSAGHAEGEGGDHTATGMAGLVLGISVHERSGARGDAAPQGARPIRLVATQDQQFPDSQPSLRYVLDDPSHSLGPREAWPGMSVPLYLARGEPVAITVVNQMREPTSVHWHGIELDSYADGVPGFSGSGTRLSPLIAPRDSFVARFTPPRAGTFIYHSHVDELRQQRGGLVGALIVRDGAPLDTANDRFFLFKLARYRDNGPFEINGKLDPDTLRLRAGQRYRVRLIALQSEFPVLTATITARADSVLRTAPDSQIVSWTPIAKDGADLPLFGRIPRPARQAISMGETYDFAFTPERAGNLRLELRRGRVLAARTPILVY